MTQNMPTKSETLLACFATTTSAFSLRLVLYSPVRSQSKSMPLINEINEQRLTQGH